MTTVFGYLISRLLDLGIKSVAAGLSQGLLSVAIPPLRMVI